jgi:hypothetical protein
MKRRELVKFLFAAAVFAKVGATSALSKSRDSDKKLYQWTLTYKLSSKMRVEEYLEKEREWQKSSISHINAKYKKAKKLLQMKFEFYETACSCQYVFDSKESFEAWYQDIQKHGVIDHQKRKKTISEITWTSSNIEVG